MDFPLKIENTRTFSLFRENQIKTKSFEKLKETESPPPIFNLKDDHDDVNEFGEEETPCLSLKKLYLEENDPTEYLFAIKIFGNYSHWERLVKCAWFKPHLQVWRKELELKLQAEGVQHLRQIAASGGPKGLNAAKFLAQKTWMDTHDKKPGRGRPRQEEIDAQMKEEVQKERDTLAEMERLGLKVVNG
jgi:hypothetical protein